MNEIHAQEARVLDKLTDLARQQKALVTHILECPSCKAGFLDELAEEEVTLETPDYGAVLRYLESRSPGLLQMMGEWEAQGRELYRRLRAIPAAEREERVRGGELRSWPLIHLLLSESQRVQARAPERSRELASLALVAVDGIRAVDQVRAAQEVRARSHTLQANARRLLGDWSGAERLFRTASRHLTSPPEASDRGFYCQVRALLCLDRDRLDEAAELLWRAAQIFGRHGETGDQGFCLALLGFLCLEGGDAGRAQPLLTHACLCLEPRAHGGLWSRARLALALCHAWQGRSERARRLAERTRPHLHRVSGAAEQQALAWLETRIAGATQAAGAAGAVGELPGPVRPDFLEAGGLRETGMVSLDLSRLAEARRAPAYLDRLVDEVLAHLPHRARHLAVLAALHHRSIFRGHEGPEF